MGIWGPRLLEPGGGGALGHGLEASVQRPAEPWPPFSTARKDRVGFGSLVGTGMSVSLNQHGGFNTRHGDSGANIPEALALRNDIGTGRPSSDSASVPKLQLHSLHEKQAYQAFV
jgi:hypothetical protein